MHKVVKHLKLRAPWVNAYGINYQKSDAGREGDFAKNI